MRLPRTSRLLSATALIAIAAISSADFLGVMQSELEKTCGGLEGMLGSDSLFSPVECGQIFPFRRTSRGFVEDLFGRTPNDYRNEVRQADFREWIEFVSEDRQSEVSHRIFKSKEFDGGQIIFTRERTTDKIFQKALTAVTSLLNIQFNSKYDSNMTITVNWDKSIVTEFQPNGLNKFTYELSNWPKSEDPTTKPLALFKNINTHESWMVTRTLKLQGLKISIDTDRPSTDLSVGMAGIPGVGFRRYESGTYEFNISQPVLIGSNAKNIQRGQLYKYANLKMPPL